MKQMLIVAAALWMQSSAALPAPAPRVGDRVSITLTRDTSQESEGSTSSSHDQDSVIEEVVAVTDAGIELRYDLPSSIPAADRARQWQLPVVVLRRAGTPDRVRNRAELESRLTEWLRAAEIPRSACGHWVFTWNAFKIDCDPDAALASIAAFAMGPDTPQPGSFYRSPGTTVSLPLTLRTGADGRNELVGQALIDADAVRQQLVEEEAVVAELGGKSQTPDIAQRAHASDRIAGTVSVTFEVDAAGRAVRRTDRAVVRITNAAGLVNTRTSKTVLERNVVTDDTR